MNHFLILLYVLIFDSAYRNLHQANITRVNVCMYVKESFKGVACFMRRT